MRMMEEAGFVAATRQIAFALAALRRGGGGGGEGGGGASTALGALARIEKLDFLEPVEVIRHESLVMKRCEK